MDGAHPHKKVKNPVFATTNVDRSEKSNRVDICICFWYKESMSRACLSPEILRQAIILEAKNNTSDVDIVAKPQYGLRSVGELRRYFARELAEGRALYRTELQAAAKAAALSGDARVLIELMKGIKGEEQSLDVEDRPKRMVVFGSVKSAI
jgi:hypothetical protein